MSLDGAAQGHRHPELDEYDDLADPGQRTPPDIPAHAPVWRPLRSPGRMRGVGIAYKLSRDNRTRQVITRGRCPSSGPIAVPSCLCTGILNDAEQCGSARRSAKRSGAGMRGVSQADQQRDPDGGRLGTTLLVNEVREERTVPAGPNPAATRPEGGARSWPVKSGSWWSRSRRLLWTIVRGLPGSVLVAAAIPSPLLRGHGK